MVDNSNEWLAHIQSLTTHAKDNPQEPTEVSQAEQEIKSEAYLKKYQSRLKNYAIKQLSRREFTQAELHSKLTLYIDRWIAPDLKDSMPSSSDRSIHSENTAHTGDEQLHTLRSYVAWLLNELKHKDYQNDARASRAIVRSGLHKGRGKRRIAYDLSRRKADITEVQNELDTVDWLRQAVLVRSKRFGSRLPTTPKEKARQLRFLQYRGFEPSLCYQAIATQLDELQETNEPDV